MLHFRPLRHDRRSQSLEVTFMELMARGEPPLRKRRSHAPPSGCRLPAPLHADPLPKREPRRLREGQFPRPIWRVIGGITALAIALVVAPFGASTVLLFGHPNSPLAQPRNIVLGNTVAALVSVVCVALLGHAPWVMGLAVGGTIALGQQQRCLHPPAGAVALLGVLLQAKPAFVLMPVFTNSVLRTRMAVLFSRTLRCLDSDPHPWF